MWGFAAAAIVADGQHAVLRRVAEVEAEEALGAIAASWTIGAPR